ncbi:MAG: hypothetical protein E7662_02360 [Ruminococcaceae bacterium]|nr:hypothetical protein [Oscillospiraceae bacterium]
MKFDERDFDSMLAQTVSDLPPEDIVSEVTPWKKSMHRVLIGLAMSSLTLNFWCLNYILPAIGFILMLLGFRTLHRENTPLKACYAITLIRSVYYFPMLILNATIYQQTFYESGWMWWLNVGNLILQFIQLVCLWQGIRGVQRKAGLDEHAGGAVWLMIWFGSTCLLSFIHYSGIILAVLIIIVYILAIRSLWKLAGEMDEAGYMIEAAPVRVPDRMLAGIIVGALAIGLALAYIFGGTYHMDWQPLAASQNAEVTEIRAHLISLGFPAEILDDLTDEDILDCKGAKRVALCVREHPFNDGRFVQETRKNSSGYLSFHRTTVYDVKELVLTGIAVELPTEREHWKIFHHFRWAADPGYFGTESIQLWPAYRDGNDGWGKASDCTGRVLYDKSGMTYTAPYISLGEETFTSNSMFWGQSVSTDVFAEFTLPNNGENQRGYIAYTIKEMNDGAIVSAWINYTHQQTWAQYPALTAKQQRMANSWNEAGAFKTIQDALQFYPKDGDLRIIGGESDD